MNTLNYEKKYLENLVRAVLTNSDTGTEPFFCLGPTYIAFRKKGHMVSESWSESSHLEDALSEAKYGIEQKIGLDKFDTVELCLSYNYENVALDNINTVFSNIHRGIRGIEIRYGELASRYSPTKQVATNRSFTKIIKDFFEKNSLTSKTFEQEGGVINSFSAEQLLISIQPDFWVTVMHRGSRLISSKNISKHALQIMIQEMGQWLLNNVADNGRLTYKYWPSRGEESTADNMIRQFMGNLCLIRYSNFTGDSNHLKAATLSLDYNLKQFYKLYSGFGIISYNGKAKLGASAIAALALLEHPQNEKYLRVLDSLNRGILALWQSDGSFRTFFLPVDRNDNQNFYPGEALLFWVGLYKKYREQQLLKRIIKSFGYYRRFYRRDLNPAFIPWHTQAYKSLYEVISNEEFCDFIFEMNDWLLSMQQFEKTRYDDVKGRFYDPKRSYYGPPHASSTGVYLEGLTDAFSLATKMQDAERVQLYGQAIFRGIRSLRQLQFKDAIDMFYISKRSRVKGGVRTTVYDNTIRIDNVQHGLMAMMKVHNLDGFELQSFE